MTEALRGDFFSWDVGRIPDLSWRSADARLLVMAVSLPSMRIFSVAEGSPHTYDSAAYLGALSRDL